MLLEWTQRDELLTETAPQTLYEAICSNLTRSQLEVRSAEATPDSFEITAALKSRRIFLQSAAGKSTNGGSVHTTIRFAEGKLTILTRNPPVIVVMQLAVILLCLLLSYRLVTAGRQSIAELLFPVVIGVAFCGYACSAVLKCHKEAIRAANTPLIHTGETK